MSDIGFFLAAPLSVAWPAIRALLQGHRFGDSSKRVWLRSGGAAPLLPPRAALAAVAGAARAFGGALYGGRSCGRGGGQAFCTAALALTAAITFGGGPCFACGSTCCLTASRSTLFPFPGSYQGSVGGAFLEGGASTGGGAAGGAGGLAGAGNRRFSQYYD